ncbi:MAG: restriction endonuclease subunit S [Myxococcales bacterium]|nr:MAG: restriction endonuclease subunit S [Myxococcales bacterium]
MVVKPGYKQTEVGVIPEDWEIEAIEKMVEASAPICYGVVQVGRHIENGIPIVAIKFVKEIANSPLHRASADIERPYTRSRVKANDVLISIKGTIGRVGVVPKGFEGNISRELARLRLAENYSPKYVAYQLENPHTQERIFRAVVGTTRLEFSIATLRNFEIPIPPTTTEQATIAEALSDVDALIVGLDHLIAKKRNIKQAAMQELLTGKRRLPGFDRSGGKVKQIEVGAVPEDWTLDYIENDANITTGRKNTQDRIEDGEFPFFVRSQTIERINSYSFDGEAVLTAGDGVGTGKIFHYIKGKFDVHQRVYRISEFSERLNGYFFFLYFSTHFYNRIMQMTAKSSVDSVRREMIARMPIPLPPTIDEQVAIAAVLSDMDDEITALEARRDKTKALKQGMMQELLTGKTRLV